MAESRDSLGDDDDIDFGTCDFGTSYGGASSYGSKSAYMTSAYAQNEFGQPNLYAGSVNGYRNGAYSSSESTAYSSGQNSAYSSSQGSVYSSQGSAYSSGSGLYASSDTGYLSANRGYGSATYSTGSPAASGYSMPTPAYSSGNTAYSGTTGSTSAGYSMPNGCVADYTTANNYAGYANYGVWQKSDEDWKHAPCGKATPTLHHATSRAHTTHGHSSGILVQSSSHEATPTSIYAPVKSHGAAQPARPTHLHSTNANPITVTSSHTSSSQVHMTPTHLATQQAKVNAYAQSGGYPRVWMRTALHVFDPKIVSRPNTDDTKNKKDYPFFQGVDWLWSNQVQNGVLVPDSVELPLPEKIPVILPERPQDLT